MLALLALQLTLTRRAPVSMPTDAPATEAQLRIVNSLLCVRCRLGSQVGWFMIDSGAYCGGLKLDVVRSQNALIVAKQVGRTQKRTFVRMSALTFGGVRVSDPVFWVDRSAGPGPLVPGTRERVIGSIGFNILRMMRLTIDFHQCRLWADYPLVDSHSIYGARRPMLQTKLSTDSDSVPRLECQFGDKKVNALLDTGTFACTLSPAFAKKNGRHVFLGPTISTIGYAGIFPSELGLVDSLSLDKVVIKYPTILVGSRSNATFEVVGWSALCALGVVSCDFSNGELIAYPSKSRIDYWDFVLSLYGATIDDNELVMHEDYRLNLTIIRSMFGVKMRDGSMLRNRSHWQPTVVGLGQMLRPYQGINQPNLRKIEYIFNGKRLSFYLPSLTQPAHAPSIPNPAVEPKSSKFSAPGYYLIRNTGPICIPAGYLWATNSSDRIVGKGCVPPIPPPIHVGSLWRWTIPSIPERLDDLWVPLGWPTNRSPFIVEPNSEIKPAPLDGHIELAANSALASGSASFILRRGTSGVFFDNGSRQHD